LSASWSSIERLADAGFSVVSAENREAHLVLATQHGKIQPRDVPKEDAAAYVGCRSLPGPIISTTPPIAR
jgi:hypothetical protein